MERFNQDEMAPIHQAIMAITDPYQQAAALTKACNVAQEADALIREGGSIEPHAQADALTKAVISAVQSLAKREKGSPLSDAEMKQRQEAARSKRDGETGPIPAGVRATGIALGAGAGAAINLRRAKSREAIEAAGRAGGKKAVADVRDFDRYKAGAPAYLQAAVLAPKASAATRYNSAYQDGAKAAARRAKGKVAAAGAAVGGSLVGASHLSERFGWNRDKYNASRAEKTTQDSLRKGGDFNSTAPDMPPSGHHPSRKGGVGYPQNMVKPPQRKQKKHQANRSNNGPTERRHTLDPEAVSKAVASMPLAKRAVAVALYNEGHHDELRKLFLGPALMAARAALPTIARSAASAGSRMFGAGAGAASSAASGAMAGGRAGMRGLAAGAGKVKSAWNATRNSRMGGAAGAAMNGIMAADTVASGAKAAGSWARKNKRGLAVAGGVGAAGAAAGGAYAASRPRQPAY